MKRLTIGMTCAFFAIFAVPAIFGENAAVDGFKTAIDARRVQILKATLETYQTDLETVKKDLMKESDLGGATAVLGLLKKVEEDLAQLDAGTAVLTVAPADDAPLMATEYHKLYVSARDKQLTELRDSSITQLEGMQKAFLQSDQLEGALAAQQVVDELKTDPAWGTPIEEEADKPEATADMPAEEPEEDAMKPGSQEFMARYEPQTYAGNYYKIVDTNKISWQAAKERCESMGGHLVAINSYEESEFIKDMIGAKPYWLGASDAEEEGHWKWVDGEPVGYTNWKPGQPDNAGDEDFMSSSGSYRGKWCDRDADYAVIAGFVCEWEGEGGSGPMTASDDSETDLPKKAGPSKLSTNWQNALVIVEGNKGRGSGFICRIKERFFVLTNSHVLTGNKTFTLNLVNGSQLPAGDIYGAIDYDLAIISIPDQENYLEIFEDMSSHVTPGEKIMVVGNAMGGGVARPVNGLVKGVGPSLIEVDAKFVSGHSGSPIIHTESGEVVGIATFTSNYDMESLQKRDKEGLEGMAKETRWFGYRVDNVPNWEKIDWDLYVKQSEMLDAVKSRSDGFIEWLRTGGSSYNGDQGIGNAVSEFNRAAGRANSEDRFYKVAENYLNRLKTTATEDIASAKRQRLYSFISKGIEEQERFREAFTEIMEKEVLRVRGLRGK